MGNGFDSWFGDLFSAQPREACREGPCGSLQNELRWTVRRRKKVLPGTSEVQLPTGKASSGYLAKVQAHRDVEVDGNCDRYGSRAGAGAAAAARGIGLEHRRACKSQWIEHLDLLLGKKFVLWNSPPQPFDLLPPCLEGLLNIR
jgi:hypothetical protein